MVCYVSPHRSRETAAQTGDTQWLFFFFPPGEWTQQKWKGSAEACKRDHRNGPFILSPDMLIKFGFYTEAVLPFSPRNFTLHNPSPTHPWPRAPGGSCGSSCNIVVCLNRWPTSTILLWYAYCCSVELFFFLLCRAFVYSAEYFICSAESFLLTRIVFLLFRAFSFSA